LEWNKSIEVYSLVEGELKKKSNFPLLLTPASACIEYISDQLAFEVFGGENVVLLDNENYQIPDTASTRGI